MTTYSPDFLAGLITGEGCFTLSVNRLRQSKGAGWLRITPVFSMTMTECDVMQRVAESFRHYDLPVYLQDRVSTSRAGEKRPALCLQLNGQKRLLRVTDFFLPHLDGAKMRAAAAVYDFCLHRLERTYRGIDDFDIECVERVREANANNGWRQHTIADLRDYKQGRAKPGRYSPTSERKPESAAEMTAPADPGE